MSDNAAYTLTTLVSDPFHTHTHTLRPCEIPSRARFANYNHIRVRQPTLSPNTHTLTLVGSPPGTHTFVAGGITGTTAPVQRAPIAADIAAVEAGLRAMITTIEADRKARPVHAAIQATHRAFRSDGRPHHYQDPLLDD